MKNKFNPKLLTISVSILMSLFIVVPNGYAGTQLSDIQGHWAMSTIQKMVDQGVVLGMPDGSFKPDNSISRAEFATLVVKAFKLEYRAGKVFDDTSRHWARDYVSAANAFGIVNGYNEVNFGPDDPITREQMAVMVVKAAKIQNSVVDLNCSDSARISAWAKEAVATAYAKGVIKGMPDGNFRPQANATRAEAVVVLNNILQLSVNTPAATTVPQKAPTGKVEEPAPAAVIPGGGGGSTGGGGGGSSTPSTPGTNSGNPIAKPVTYAESAVMGYVFEVTYNKGFEVNSATIRYTKNNDPKKAFFTSTSEGNNVYRYLADDVKTGDTVGFYVNDMLVQTINIPNS